MTEKSVPGKHQPNTPSSSLMANLRLELARHVPFAQMVPADLDYFLSSVEQLYFAPDEVVLGPSGHGLESLMWIRRGEVSAQPGTNSGGAQNFHLEAGDFFPLGAELEARMPAHVYRAVGDTYVFALPLSAVQELGARSAGFAEFLQKGAKTFSELSRQTAQISFAAQAMAEQPLDTPLAQLMRQPALTCEPLVTLRQALDQMNQHKVGSILVCSPAGRALGIFSQADLLPKVVLAGAALDDPIERFMASPVHTLSHEHTAGDAALLMSRHGIRHVPVTQDDRPVGMVSERDLFAFQRLNLRQIGSALRSAPDVPALRQGAQDIRHLARKLLAQGLSARVLTTMISALNDALTERLLWLKAQEHQIDLSRLCWLALGSEGRAEQTISTDQDNALILPDGLSPAELAATLAFAESVNQALDECGYPLCKGGVMAGNPACCLSLSQWRERFAHWIEHGAPLDLLNASIYFDFRPLAGDAGLAKALQTDVSQWAQRTPRFHKQLALNALGRRAPLNWHGGIATDDSGCVDLKLQGTGIYVDVARLYALAHGLSATNTRQRLELIGPLLGVASTEYQSWVSGFEFLQMLRLRKQFALDLPLEEANQVKINELNDIDRRVLKEAFREARSMLSRLQLDYDR